MVLKVGALALGAMAAIVFALDPTVQVAMIFSIPTTIAAIGAFIVGIRNSRKLNTIGSSVDGKLSQLIETKEALSHSLGVKQGSDSERAIQKDENSNPSE